jgi:uncharacterized metal-binding protein
MPSGKTHTVATVGGAIAVAIIMGREGFPTSEVLATFSGYMTTLVINPDLDLNTRRPKDVLPYLWWLFWWPYSRSVKHRSPFSHWPVIGTLARAFYFFLTLFILTFFFDFVNKDIPYYYFILGMVISDTIHAVMDVVTTTIRRAI